MKNAFEKIINGRVEKIEEVKNGPKRNKGGGNKQKPLQKIGNYFSEAWFKPVFSIAHGRWLNSMNRMTLGEHLQSSI